MAEGCLNAGRAAEGHDGQDGDGKDVVGSVDGAEGAGGRQVSRSGALTAVIAGMAATATLRMGGLGGRAKRLAFSRLSCAGSAIRQSGSLGFSRVAGLRTVTGRPSTRLGIGRADGRATTWPIEGVRPFGKRVSQEVRPKIKQVSAGARGAISTIRGLS